MAKDKEEVHCKMGSCPKCFGGMMLVLGILVLLNAAYDWMSWAFFVGGILALMGLSKIIMPHCPHCKE